RMYDLFADPGPHTDGDGDGRQRVNPELSRLIRDYWRAARRNDRRPRRGYRDGPSRFDSRAGRGRVFTPTRPQVLDRLDRSGLLPAIYFIFSRQGCDAAVLQCLHDGVRLTTPAEAREIRAYVKERCRDIPSEDLGVLGYAEWLDGLCAGVAAHHAGML